MIYYRDHGMCTNVFAIDNEYKKKVGRAKKQLSGTDIFKTVITNVFNSFHTILWLEK